MGRWPKAGLLVLLSLHAVAQHQAAADNLLPPLLSPVFNGICDHVPCGKGKCSAAADSTFGFACECDSGWTQLHLDANLRFLPCVIPNCSMNYSCSNDSTVVAPTPSPPSTDFSIFDPCSWAYCGGGTCIKTSSFNHECKCKQGFSNLLNVTSFPCYRNCSFGADCSSLGITLTNSSSRPPASSDLSDSSQSSVRDTVLPSVLLQLLLFLVSVFMIQVA